MDAAGAAFDDAGIDAGVFRNSGKRGQTVPDIYTDGPTAVHVFFDHDKVGAQVDSQQQRND